jgi:hypothetical protein
MAQLKVWNGSAWVDAKAVYYWDGSAWQKKKLKVWNGSAWIDAIQYIYTKQYTPTALQNFWNNGSPNNQYPGEHIQGTWDSTTSNIRRALIIFPYSTIAADLAGATILSVKLRLMRMNTSHGTSGEGIAVINSHNISSIPSSWTGTGLTQQATAGLYRGEEKWIDLPIAVGNGLRDGTIKGLALSTTNTNIAYYVRFDASRTLLEITYEK